MTDYNMSTPKIKDNNFYKKITTKYKEYIIPKKQKTFRQICYPKDYVLQPQQLFLSKYINPDTPYKGALIFHRIGAGKTCTAVRIGEAWKHHKKIVVVTPASLKGNFREELRSRCAKGEYLTNSERSKIVKLHPSTNEYKEIIKKSDDRIDKYYEIYSYNKFVELAEEGIITLRNSLLIVDEIQNMVSEKGKYYNVLYDTIYSAPSNLRVVLLSATPMFDKPVEIALTMNLLKIPEEFPTGRDFDKKYIKIYKKGKKIDYEAINLDVFKEKLKGYVSYYRGAPPYVFPETTIRYVNCEMTNFQYRSYLTVLQKEFKTTGANKIKSRLKAFRKGDILKLPNNFFIGTRIISNIAFPNKGINDEGFDSFKGVHLKIDNLKKYSIKFYKILKKIKNATGPVFIYSNFKEYGGIRSLVKVLEYHGYKNYSKHKDGRKRFSIWSGDEKLELREEIKAVFNQPNNYNGSKIKIFVASSAAKEGLSLKNVRQVHILEPYWNRSLIKQVIGRSVRYCSHKGLSAEDRNVKVYIYLAVHQDEQTTIDQHIQKMAMRKNKLIEQFELAIKESAVDCTLFKNANVYTGEEKITCNL
jgi:superfamily II DNA or RNA helicase